MDGGLGIIELLSLRGFDPTIPTKLVRHEDSRYDVRELHRQGWLEPYQSFQSKPIFHKVRQIIAFLGAGRTRARFVGVYEVLGHRPGEQVQLPTDFPFPEWTSEFFYDLVKRPGYEDLEGRVVIEWGKGTLSWHQHLRDKPVIELLPSGDTIPVFDDYLQFVIRHEQLVAIVTGAEAHREWRSRLSAVAGVYLIQATTTGQQYIGSAYGDGGVWARWQAYATNGHGANKLLKRLVREDPAYPEAFRFSLLQVLPKSMTRTDVIRWEGVFKDKLGTRATGLNLN